MAEIVVIMPTYNRKEMINAALKSLLAQTFCDWEAAIIDGSDVPSPPDVMDTRIRYFREKDYQISGLAQARNFGVQQTDSRFIAYLDDDEYIHIKNY